MFGLPVLLRSPTHRRGSAQADPQGEDDEELHEGEASACIIAWGEFAVHQTQQNRDSKPEQPERRVLASRE